MGMAGTLNSFSTVRRWRYTATFCCRFLLDGMYCFCTSGTILNANVYIFTQFFWTALRFLTGNEIVNSKVIKVWSSLWGGGPVSTYGRNFIGHSHKKAKRSLADCKSAPPPRGEELRWTAEPLSTLPVGGGLRPSLLGGVPGRVSRQPANQPAGGVAGGSLSKGEARAERPPFGSLPRISQALLAVPGSEQLKAWLDTTKEFS